MPIAGQLHADQPAEGRRVDTNVRLFLDNADRGENAANDELVEQLTQRIRSLAQPPEWP